VPEGDTVRVELKCTLPVLVGLSLDRSCLDEGPGTVEGMVLWSEVVSGYPMCTMQLRRAAVDAAQ
jgi:hypothetical protein